MAQAGHTLYFLLRGRPGDKNGVKFTFATVYKTLGILPSHHLCASSSPRACGGELANITVLTLQELWVPTAPAQATSLF